MEEESGATLTMGCYAVVRAEGRDWMDAAGLRPPNSR